MRVAAALFLSCAACATDVPPPDVCDGTERTDTALSPLRIGFEADGAFVPVESGEPMELVLGTQGGWMILPVIEAESAELTPALCVTLEAEVTGHPEPIAHRSRVRFEPSNGALYGGPFQFFLSFDVSALEDRAALVTARVGASETSIEVVLANRE